MKFHCASLVGALALVFLAGRGECLAAKHEKTTLDKVPAAVKATILKEAKDGKITEVETETEGDQVVYEAEYTLDGKGWKIHVAADGKLLSKKAEADDDDDDDDDEDEKD